MTDSNRARLSYIGEVTWGVTPGSPDMQEMRITSESLIKNIQNITSNELRSDRQVTDLIQVGKDAGGDINFELSYGSFDDFLQSALFSAAWSTAVNISATDIAAAVTGSKLTSTSTNFITAGIVAGMWIKVAGFTGNTANNRFYRVTSVTSANEIVVSPAPAAADASGETVTIKGAYIRNGTTQKSFTIEKGFLDAAEYFRYTGMVVNNLSLNVEAQQIVTGSVGFIGKDGTLQGTSLDASPTAANSNEIMNAIGNVGSIRENGVEVASPNYIRSISLELANNLRQQYAVGSDSLIGVGTGKCDVTGTINTYFGNSDVLDKFYDGTRTSIDFRLTDAAGNTYIFDIPEIEFESGNATAQGQDQDVFAEMGFRAMRDPTYGFTIQVCRFPA